MAINPSRLHGIGGSLLDALQLRLDSQAEIDRRRFAAFQFDQAAELLPDPDAWAVTGTGDDAALLMLAGATLFRISREAPADDDPRFVVTCQAAEVSEVRLSRVGQRTFWHFEFRHRSSLTIEGEFDYPNRPAEPEMFNQAEVFARALARRVGWQVGPAD